jgi:hypothetical protein
VEAALDSWSSRAATRDALLRVTPNPAPVLIDIANSERRSYFRVTHAINLLGTFNTRESETALGQIALKDNRPQIRCSAMGALTELNAKHAIPVLLNKLDDHAVCMQLQVTDPAREFDVYVSDEAVRLLELATGQSFGQELLGAHRATKAWKDWWAKQKRSQ